MAKRIPSRRTANQRTRSSDRDDVNELDMLIPGLFGETLRSHRARCKMTQEELAARSGVDRSHISDIERGANSPSLVVICKLADGLGIEVSELFAQVQEMLAQMRRR